jgi:hypothetical protein
MSVVAWLGVVSAITTILAFLFAVWVWMKADSKLRELEGVIQSAYDISGTVLWDMQTVQSEDPATRLRNAEKSLGVVAALRVITGKYAKTALSFRGTEIEALLERGVIWSTDALNEIERSDSVQEIWLVTPDLEPDLSDPTTGKVVAGNLKARKKYVYFYPSGISDFESVRRRLLANVGATRTHEASRVTVVPIGPKVRGQIFQRGNTIIFFAKDSEWGAYSAFEEVVFTKISGRGVFWQAHSPAIAAELRATLKQELERWRAAGEKVT